MAPAGSANEDNRTTADTSADTGADACCSRSALMPSRLAVQLRFALPVCVYADLYELRALGAQLLQQIPLPLAAAAVGGVRGSAAAAAPEPGLWAVTAVPDGQAAMESVCGPPAPRTLAEERSESAVGGEGAPPHQTVTMHVHWDLQAEAQVREEGGREEGLLSVTVDLPVHLQYAAASSSPLPQSHYRDLEVPPPRVHLCPTLDSGSSSGSGSGVSSCADVRGSVLVLPETMPAPVLLQVPTHIALGASGSGADFANFSTDVLVLCTALAVLLALAALQR